MVSSRIAIRLRPALLAAALALAALSAPNVANAQGIPPGKTIHMIVGFAPGGATDIVARVLAQKLSEHLGSQVIVENRSGGGGTIATNQVGRSDPDGTTLLMTPLANAVNETLAAKTLNARFGEQLTGVAPVAETANVLVAHPSLDVKSVADLIALAKKSPPGEILAATSGRGTSTHLTTELFNLMAGIKLGSVHYRGGGDITKDLLSGQVKLMFATIAPVLELVKAGSLRGIATTGPKRDSALPDLPTVAESGLPGFDVRLWLAILAPSGTPRPIIDQLAAATAKAQEAPEVKAALAAQGFNALSGTPDEFNAFYRSEVEKWRKVVEAAGLANQ
ncbi:MAG: tripartite tricarboxylate transporter substrate-binding protein [Hyphomicrobiales bacterium]